MDRVQQQDDDSTLGKIHHHPPHPTAPCPGSSMVKCVVRAMLLRGIVAEATGRNNEPLLNTSLGFVVRDKYG
jgi:hypothetical protein